MQYRKDRQGTPLSILGYGCMRFTRRGGGIDLDKAERELLLAIEEGVNYFDTAYIYPGSETALGTLLARNHLRDRVNIATKLPPYLARSRADLDRLLEEQLRRLQTDRIDYYLMHMLTDVEGWRKLEALGIREWLEENKAAGRIRQAGFSFHGNTETFLQLLEVYDWDFCQIQYNYMDETAQAGRRGLQAAAADRGLPVIIMEPLRGGRLANQLPEKAASLLQSSRRGWTAAEWGLHWLWDQPEVTCVLSGMNSLEMVQENCRAADRGTAGCLTEADRQVLEQVRTVFRQAVRVNCTACGYCMPCPHGVDIPAAFRCYNRMSVEGKGRGRKEYWQTVGLRREAAFPSQCVNCGLCERHCPQGVEIRHWLREADKALRPLPYRLASSIAKRFLFGK